MGNITDGSVIGIRAPYLRIGGNTQFQMMNDQFFVYDSSITAPLSRIPVWPYTLLYRMPHKCHGNANNCPSRSHPIWELPINSLDRRDDQNFERHYGNNRAPLSLSFDTAWLKVNKGFTKELAKWMRKILIDHSDVYFVAQLQVIQWMQNPSDSNSLRDFVEWKEKCDIKGQAY